MDHIKRYNANPDVKMIIVLGEVGGVEEYDIVSAIKSGDIRKSVSIVPGRRLLLKIYIVSN